MKERFEKNISSNEIFLPADWMFEAVLKNFDQFFIDDIRATAARNIIIMFKKSSSLQDGLSFSLDNFNNSLDPQQDIGISEQTLDLMVDLDLLKKEDSVYSISELFKSKILLLIENE
jgi:hypothetical protein